MNRGRRKLEEYFYVDTSCDGELWFSKENDETGYENSIDINYEPLCVRFYKSFPFKNNEEYNIPFEILKAVYERLEEIKNKRLMGEDNE